MNAGYIITDDAPQGFDEWRAARCGIVTASTIASLVTPTLKIAANDTSRRLVANLAAERITSHVDPGPVTWDMMRGIEAEPVVRDLYSTHYEPVVEAGLMVRHWQWGRVGYSPDGLVGDDGLIEIKTRKPALHLQSMLSGQPPAEHMAQLQCGLMVSGRAWVDYVSYCGGMALWRCRVEPDYEWQAALYMAAQTAEGAITKAVTDYNAMARHLPATQRIDYDEIEV